MKDSQNIEIEMFMNGQRSFGCTACRISFADLNRKNVKHIAMSRNMSKKARATRSWLNVFLRTLFCRRITHIIVFPITPIPVTISWMKPSIHQLAS